MKLILFFTVIILSHFTFAQDNPEGDNCLHYNIRLQPEINHADLTSGYLWTQAPFGMGNTAFQPHPIYIGQKEIKIRFGDFISIKFLNCQLDPMVIYDFNADSINFEFLSGGFIDEELVAVSEGYYHHRFQFTKDAQFLLPTYHANGAMTGQFFLINVNVVLSNEESAADQLYDPSPFLYQEGNIVHVYSKKDGLGELSIVNSAGKVIQKMEIEKNKQFDISPYQKGIYIFIVEEDGIISHGKAVRF